MKKMIIRKKGRKKERKKERQHGRRGAVNISKKKNEPSVL